MESVKDVEIMNLGMEQTVSVLISSLKSTESVELVTLTQTIMDKIVCVIEDSLETETNVIPVMQAVEHVLDQLQVNALLVLILAMFLKMDSVLQAVMEVLAQLELTYKAVIVSFVMNIVTNVNLL